MKAEFESGKLMSAFFVEIRTAKKTDVGNQDGFTKAGRCCPGLRKRNGKTQSSFLVEVRNAKRPDFGNQDSFREAEKAVPDCEVEADIENGKSNVPNERRATAHNSL